jgi:hypothetical protein
MWYESKTGIGLATAPLEAVSENPGSLSKLSISPNPTNGVLYLKGVEPLDLFSVTLFDLQGRLVWRKKLKGGVLRLQVPPGIYFLIHEDGTTFKKIKVSVVR